MPSLADLNADTKLVRALLRGAGVPPKLLDATQTRAYRTGRKRGGLWPTNREARWKLNTAHPQYGTEQDCKTIYLRLLGMLFEFSNAPDLDDVTADLLAKHLGHRPVPGTYRDALTLERLDYETFLTEVLTPVPGHSDIHIGHEDPTLIPKHVPANISWRAMRSNLIQGNMTLAESRTKLVELIARYFDLGEVTIRPDASS